MHALIESVILLVFHPRPTPFCVHVCIYLLVAFQAVVPLQVNCQLLLHSVSVRIPYASTPVIDLVPLVSVYEVNPHLKIGKKRIAIYHFWG